MRTSPVPLLLAGVAAAQSPCLDQTNTPNYTNGLEITSVQPVAQTITCSRGGRLTRVDLVGIRHHRGVSTSPLDVAILATANGKPTNTVLASVRLPPSRIPTRRTTLPVPLPSPVTVTAGQLIALRLSSSAAPSGQTYAWYGDAPGRYARGAVYIRANYVGPLSWDMGFRTWVDGGAASSSYGTGHPGARGVPSLIASAPPRIGTSLTVRVGSSAAGPTVGALVVGSNRANQSTPFGGTLLVQIQVVVNLAVPQTGTGVRVSVPADPSLCGASVYLQSVMTDAGASRGIAFSRGLQLTFGS